MVKKFKMDNWNAVSSNILTHKIWAKKSKNPNHKFVWINLFQEDDLNLYSITVFNAERNIFITLKVEKSLAAAKQWCERNGY